MQWICIALGCLLLGQVTPDGSGASRGINPPVAPLSGNWPGKPAELGGKSASGDSTSNPLSGISNPLKRALNATAPLSQGSSGVAPPSNEQSPSPIPDGMLPEMGRPSASPLFDRTQIPAAQPPAPATFGNPGSGLSNSGSSPSGGAGLGASRSAEPRSPFRGDLSESKPSAAGVLDRRDSRSAGAKPSAPGRRISPEEQVSAALVLPEGEPVAGRPLTLVDALSTARDRAARLAVTHAYWELARAVAEYRFSFDEYARLSEFQAGVSDRGLLQTAQAAAASLIESAELGIAEAQYELAEAAALPAGTPLPLPADLPHVGTYRTEFERIFSVQSPPPRLRLIDRLLPVELRLVVARATAAEAARDALDATSEAYRAGQADLAAVLSALRAWGAERRAFFDAVARYNHDIAEYALTVAGPDLSGERLVSMLIERKRAAAGAPPKKNDTTTTESPQGVRPAEYTEPAKTEPTLALPLAPDRSGARRNGNSERASQADVLRPTPRQPTLAPPQPTLGPPQPTSAPPGEPSKPMESSNHSEGERREEKGPQPPAAPTLPLPRNLPPTAPGEAKQRTANYSAAGSAVASPLYSALVNIDPAVRAKHLTAALFGNPAATGSAGEAIALGDCLRGSPPTSRSGVIDAYWLASRRMAQCQVFAEEAQVLGELVPVVLERRSTPGGPSEMLRLHAAQAAAQARLTDAQVELLQSQFELTRLAGRRLESAWLLPSTLPHAGPYRLSLESLPPERTNSRLVRRLASAIPTLAASVDGLAYLVVAGDTVRVQATGEYQGNRRSFGDLLEAVARETEETLAFLDRLTVYNQEIARYALAVLPPSLPHDQFVKTLVLVP